MEMPAAFPLLLLLLLPCLLTVSSAPRKPDLIPKDSYKRQILQPIPGYIPVYIKADGEPMVRTKAKPPSHVLTKATEPKVDVRSGEPEIKPRADDVKQAQEKDIKLLKTKEKYEKTKTSQISKS